MTRPRNEPATAATLLMPSAMPRWWAGKASVRIAVELAKIIAPPTPCTTRPTISHIAPAPWSSGSSAQRDRRRGEDQEAEVVHPDPAVDVAEPAQQDHEHGRDDQEAHDHPEQVAHVAGLERVEVDAAEDRRQRDEHDRGVDRRQQHAERGVGQRHPAVVRVVGGDAAGCETGRPGSVDVTLPTITCRWLSKSSAVARGWSQRTNGRHPHGWRPPCGSGQLSVSAVSSMTNDVWSELSSVPVKLIVTVCPANEETLNDFWLYPEALLRLE